MCNKCERLTIKLIQKLRYVIGKIQVLRYKLNTINLMQFFEEGNCRIPLSRVNHFSRGIRVNNKFPAGKRIEFSTDADILNIKVLYRTRRILRHMSSTGTSGIDIYVRKNESFSWKRCLAPENDLQMYIQDSIFLGPGEKVIRIFYPPFASIDSVLIRKSDFNLLMGENRKRIVVYGSSISQGCAASRPSLSYTNLLSILTDCDVLNFGFSESAKGEKKVIEYISSCNAEIIILEYDQNASLEELRKTHKNVYDTIRENSDSWIIFMTRLSGEFSIPIGEDTERVSIINETYNYAKKKKDQKIVLINSENIFEEEKSFYFTDGIHPNDLGMKVISQKLFNVILERGMLE